MPGQRTRKVFLNADVAGESTEYWEDQWSRIDLAGAEYRHREHPAATMRLLERFVPSSGRILEAGSGACTYTAALRSPSRTVVGVDLTARALAAAGRQWPDLGLVGADIRALPFPDDAFNCVISLGVVEHLEEGPGEALAEHARVLAPGGVLLVSVPWISLVKWTKDVWHFDVRRQPTYEARGRLVTSCARAGYSHGPGRFHQYEFATTRWHHYLEAAGLSVRSDHPHLVSAGVGELAMPWRSKARPVNSDLANGTPATTTPTPVTPRRGDRVRRVVIQEVATSPLERIVETVAQRALGHMIMTVAYRTS